MTTLTTSLVVRLIDKVSRPARGAANSLLGIRSAAESAGRVGLGDRLQSSMRRNNAALDRARGGMIDAAAGAYALQRALSAPIGAAMRMEDAMADINKVVDFKTPEELAEFERFIMDLSKTIPLAAQELAELAAAGGEAGLKGENLRQYVEMAAKLQTAFGVSADEAGTFMNSMRNALGLSLDETLLLSDAVNNLSNNMAANAPDLSNFMTRIAGDAKNFGIAGEQAAAFGAAMIAAGTPAEVAATSFRNMGKALVAGASATPRVQSALERLGLTSGQVAKDMQRDSLGTITDVLRRIAEVPAEARAAMSSDLFGNEARGLAPLIANADLLKEALGYVGDEADYAGSAYKEFETRAKTSGAQLLMFRNRVSGLAITVGKALLPGLIDLTDALKPVIDSLAQFAATHPDIVKNAIAATSAVIGFKIAVAGLRFAGLLGRGGALSLLALGFNTVGRAAGGLTNAAKASIGLQTALAGMSGAKLGAVDRVRAALTGIAGVTGLRAVATGFGALAAAVASVSAPVWGAVALGALAIGAAGTAIYKNWDAIAATFRGVGEALSETFAPAIARIKRDIPGLETAVARVETLFNDIRLKASEIATGIRSILGPGFFDRNILTELESSKITARAKDLTLKIISALTFGTELRREGFKAIMSLLEGMEEAFVKVLRWARGVAKNVVSAIGNIDLGANVSGPGLSGGGRSRRDGAAPGDVATVPDRRRAMGGRVQSGQNVLVGERGLEILSMSGNGHVLDNRTTERLIAATQAMRSRGSSLSSAATPARMAAPPVNVQVTINGVQDIRGAAREIGAMFEREMSERMRGLHSNGTF